MGARHLSSSPLFLCLQCQVSFPPVNMISQLLIISLVAGVSLGSYTDMYLCHSKGDDFKCFENKPEVRSCLTSGDVICGMCNRKYQFCVNGLKTVNVGQEDSYCGVGWDTVECTADRKVPA